MIGVWRLAVAGTRRPNLLEAVRTVHWTVGPRLERHLCFLTAIAADRGEHLALARVCGPRSTVATALRGAARGPTLWATPGLVLELVSRVEFLFARGKRKRLAALSTGKGSVDVAHADSSRCDLAGPFVQR
jgi:hypothetical protein